MKTPVFECLKDYNKNKYKRFHMPGHKGTGILFDGLGKEITDLDLTELAETDNLAQPKGVFYEAQKLAAKACGTAEALFLTGGSTLGNLSMLYGLCYGKKVIIDRFCHLSLFNSLVVCKATPIYVENEMADPCGVLGAVSLTAVRKAIAENPDATAVFITSPNSFGVCSNLAEIAKICHEEKMFLLVDEAHGAHFAFSDKLPATAADCGADASVQSFHKTLPALTQAAVLHINNVDLSQKITSALRLFQTSSPSYLLTASIDYARAYMQENSKKLNSLIDTIQKLSTSNIMRISDGDTLKIIIKCDGIKGEKILREHGFIPEMFGRGYIVCISTIADDEETVCKLLSLAGTLPNSNINTDFCYTTKSRATPYEAYHSEGEYIPISLSLGRISKEAVFLYPPGVPIIAPGHLITKEIIEFIKKASTEGDVFSGLNKDLIYVLK